MSTPDPDSAGAGPARTGVPGTGLVIRDVDVRAVVVPFRRPLATRVGHFARWPLLLIDVTTEQGITGRSYLAPYLATAAACSHPVTPPIRIRSGMTRSHAWARMASCMARGP